MTNTNLRTAIWFVALVLLCAWMGFSWLRYPPADRFMLGATPFDATPGLEPAHWRFLEEVRDILPDSGVVTISAAKTEDEHRLFMLSGIVLAGREVVPTSYYGVANPGADKAKWIASYRCEKVPPDSTIVVRVEDGCVCERAAQ